MQSRMFGGGGFMPPATDAPAQGGQAPMPGGVMSPNSIRNNSAFQAQFQIQQLEQQLMDAQRQYAQMQTTTMNPQQLAAMQSGMQGLAQRLAQLKQGARNQFSMEALKMNQRANMPGAQDMGIGRGATQPNQGYINQSQLMQMMAALFGGAGGAGAERVW